jgi:hypothetical protein
MMKYIFEPVEALNICRMLLIHDDDNVKRTPALLILLFNSRPIFVFIHFIFEWHVVNNHRVYTSLES